MMNIYIVLMFISLFVSALFVKRALSTYEDRYMLLFGTALICAGAFFLLWLFNTSSISDRLDYEGRQVPSYEDAIDGTPSAMLAYCDNAPRYFGDCLARLELEATVTVQARGE